jgi:hypothetical protein
MLCVKPVQGDHNRTMLDLVCSSVHPFIIVGSNSMDLAVKWILCGERCCGSPIMYFNMTWYTHTGCTVLQ